MEAFVDLLASVIKPPWSYILGVVGLIILVAPRLTEFRREIIDVRLGRRRLEIEKLRLEVLKLRLDVENRAQPEKIPDLERQVQELSVISPREAAPPEAEPESPGRLRRWLGKHPRFARPFLLFIQIILAYMMAAFAYGMVAMPVMMWSDPKGGPVLSIFMALVYLGLIWLCYRGFTVSRSVRKELSPR